MSETDRFHALVLDQQDGATRAAVRELRRDDLPEGEVLVAVAFSSLNYKDALAVTGRGKVVRRFPMVPGIDFAGTVVESGSAAYRPGDKVVLTGWGVGERHWGGLGQLARVQAGWLVPLPEGLTLQQAMGIGTAGFTAMLCVMALEERGLPEGGEVIVTGASGGVGSVAVALLAQLGCRVVASSGKTEEREYLRGLGAAEVIDRLPPAARPLESERWAAAVDTVGGAALAGLLASMKYGAAVAACGNAGGAEVQTTVFPFILRGVSLLGVESVMCPLERRIKAWDRLARDLPPDRLDAMIRVAPLRDVPALCQELVAGRGRGRVVVDVSQV